MRTIVTNYYNASNHFKSPIRREPKPYTQPKELPEKPAEVPEKHTETALLHPEPDKDTLLLLGMILLLFLSGCEDRWLLVALGYLLLF